MNLFGKLNTTTARPAVSSRRRSTMYEDGFDCDVAADSVKNRNFRNFPATVGTAPEGAQDCDSQVC
jgi:hypothetical protein